MFLLSFDVQAWLKDRVMIMWDQYHEYHEVQIERNYRDTNMSSLDAACDVGVCCTPHTNDLYVAQTGNSCRVYATMTEPSRLLLGHALGLLLQGTRASVTEAKHFYAECKEHQWVATEQ
eukprot:m.358732 g.358732  ORF g.358732 m.358732 type:complete len:119 (+) comp18263_c0_seq1:138-494(+)